MASRWDPPLLWKVKGLGEGLERPGPSSATGSITLGNSDGKEKVLGPRTWPMTAN